MVRGTAAKALLDTEAFVVTINELNNEYYASITGSSLEDVKKREAAFFQIRALQDILAHLNSWVQAKDSLFNQPEE